MALSKDQIRTIDGKVFLIPAGSETEGAQSASVAEVYAVTMSGASLSQSILCPHTGSAAASSSYFNFSTADNHSVIAWYSNANGTTKEPSESISRYFSSSVNIKLNIGDEGNIIAYKTVKSLDKHRQGINRYRISGSGIFPSSSEDGINVYNETAILFIENLIPGVTPPNAFSVNNISGSTFSFNLVSEGSGSAYGVASEGLAPTSSASTVIDGTSGYDGIINTAEYKNLGITAENSSSYLIPFTAVGKTYYNLDLSTDGAVFVRIDTNLLYPIGKITPNNPSALKAQMLYIEAGNNGPHYLASPQVAGVVVTEINVDAGDLVQDSFHPRTIRGNYYPEAFEFNLGCRVMLIRGAHDWKVQSLSDFTNTTASFDNISFSSINGGTF